MNRDEEDKQREKMNRFEEDEQIAPNREKGRAEHTQIRRTYLNLDSIYCFNRAMKHRYGYKYRYWYDTGTSIQKTGTSIR
ncbi:hypothetical protein CsSME_00012676 [Camellia sinensis var. sinensis]